MERIIIKNGTIINEGKKIEGDLSILGERIEKIGGVIDLPGKEIDAKGMIVMPGIIDDQVHFREPGLTHKADIASESRAAIAGGVTTFMEMPNTNPASLTQDILQAKYDIASTAAWCNYSFFMGASNDNIEDVLKTNIKEVCGIKVFMGSSTGNMLVDNEVVLEKIFANSPTLIATHCEDETTIRNNMAAYKAKFGEEVPFEAHPIIRNVEGCYKSSSFAVELAKKHNSRLHILHISTEEELALFGNDKPLAEKRITSEVCVHHLHFTADDYAKHGSNVKCNPAIKEPRHRTALWKALLDDRLDIIATDHAPHTKEEKAGTYFNAPSGVPLVQHAINIMLQAHQEGLISMEKIVEKMCHAPAICFEVKERGFLREGYWADIAIVDPNKKWTVLPENILYKCGWSPFENSNFLGKVAYTLVNGNIVFQGHSPLKQGLGKRLLFNR